MSVGGVLYAVCLSVCQCSAHPVTGYLLFLALEMPVPHPGSPSSVYVCVFTCVPLPGAYANTCCQHGTHATPAIWCQPQRWGTSLLVAQPPSTQGPIWALPQGHPETRSHQVPGLQPRPQPRGLPAIGWVGVGWVKMGKGPEGEDCAGRGVGGAGLSSSYTPS